jgi:predicted transcriptional regulator
MCLFLNAYVSNFAPVYYDSIIATMKTSVYSIHYDKLREWLKTMRESRNLTLRDVAKLTGRHHSVMGKVEQARRKIEIVEFVEYCDLLEVDPHEGLKVLVASIRKNAPKKST